MTVINSLGVNALSIRGAGTDYHRLSRVYESLAEANADSGFSATAGVEHVALIKGLGLAFYNHSSSQWEHTATELEANVDDLITLTGAAENSANLGTFSGSTIGDNLTIKAALQALETTLEAVDIDTDDMAALTGIAENVTNLGSFSGSTIADNQTVKAALQALETSLETMSPSATVTEIDGNVDDLITLTGAAEQATHLGTFSGSTISDSVTIKAALQALETATELRATIDDPTFTTKVSSPAFHASGSNHLVLKAMTGNDMIVHLAGAETLQVTRSGTDCRFTSNGGTGTFKFNQETDLAGGMKLAGVAVTSTAAELNILDGVTATATELNLLDGVTATTAELNYVDGVTSAIQTQLDAKAPIASPTFTGTPAAPTAAGSTNTTQLATTAFVQQEISTLIDGSPSALNTLNELAAALGDDANFSTTVTNLINANEVHIDNMATLTGAAKDAVNLGTFTGSTIADNQTIKASLQALETALELKAPLASPSLTGTVDIGGEGTLKKDGDDFEIDLSGTTGILKIGTRLVSSHTMLLGTVGFETKLQGIIALNNTSSEFKIQNSNRIYIEATDIVLDNGGVVKISDNQADALQILEGSNQYVALDTTDGAEKVEVFKNVELNGERLFFNTASSLIRLKDNQTSALKIENHDGSTQDFLDFKTANSGEQLIFGAPNQFNNTITVGVDDTGYDVKLFGATSGAYLEWDESANDLVFGGAAAVDFLAATTIDLVDNSSTALVIQQGSSETCITISTLDALPTITHNYRTVFNEDVLFVGAKDILMTDNTANALEIGESTNKYLTFDTTNSAELIHAKKDLVQNPAASITPSNNGELVVEATNNTTLTFKLKGSDGTVRSGTITLS